MGQSWTGGKRRENLEMAEKESGAGVKNNVGEKERDAQGQSLRV